VHVRARLDLRFVPDAQSFEGRRARDTAAEVPAGYEAPPAFATAALQHTNVKLTWDADDSGRKRALSKRVTAEELREDDFKVGPMPALPSPLFCVFCPFSVFFPPLIFFHAASMRNQSQRGAFHARA
jgi:hypothetical protein